MSVLSRIKKALFRQPTIRFKCHSGRFDVGVPVDTAKSVFPQWLGGQLQNRMVKFARCPGMYDYAQHGYIISAWCDIKIKANKQGLIVILDSRAGQELQPVEMSFDVIDGLAPIGEGVAKKVVKLPTPWGIFTKPGYSVMLMPAMMHSPFLDKIHVYPGIVDSDNFHSCGVIFSALKECEFTIPAGTPLLQAIPFKRENMTAVSGKATEYEFALQFFKFASKVTGYYRRKFHVKKKFTIKIEDQE